jgi:hypothetical protein
VGRGDLHTCLEELSATDNDATYILASTTGTTGQFQLASGPDGTDAAHVVSFRARGSGGPGVEPAQLLVELYEGATWRGSLEVDLSWPAPYVWENFGFPVYGVTAWSDLRLHFTPTRLFGTQKMRVTAAQLSYVESAISYTSRGRLSGSGVIAGRLACAGIKRGALPHC